MHLENPILIPNLMHLVSNNSNLLRHRTGTTMVHLEAYTVWIIRLGSNRSEAQRKDSRTKEDLQNTQKCSNSVFQIVTIHLRVI